MFICLCYSLWLSFHQLFFFNLIFLYPVFFLDSFPLNIFIEFVSTSQTQIIHFLLFYLLSVLLFICLISYSLWLFSFLHLVFLPSIFSSILFFPSTWNLHFPISRFFSFVFFFFFSYFLFFFFVSILNLTFYF